MLAGLLVQLLVGVFSVVPRLRSDISVIQQIDLAGAMTRLLLLAGLVFVFLNAGVAVGVATAAIFLQYLLLRRYAARAVDLDAPENAEDRQAILKLIKHLAANAVFYCLQGQITIFLISFCQGRELGCRSGGARAAGDDFCCANESSDQRLRSGVCALPEPAKTALALCRDRRGRGRL